MTTCDCAHCKLVNAAPALLEAAKAALPYLQSVNAYDVAKALRAAIAAAKGV